MLSSVTVTNATVYTVSVFVKSYGRRWLYLSAPDASSNNYNCWFDLQNGVVGTKGSSVTSANISNAGNGWYRVSTTSTSTTITNYFYASSSDADNSTTLTANGFDGLIFWGAQFEAGAFATSYIATVASQVTRAVDVATMTGTNFSSWFNNGEGTLYGETTGYTVGNVIIGTINDGTANNAILLSTITVNGRLFVRRNTTVEADITTSAITNSAKLVGAYRANDCAATANGTTPNTDLSVLLPILDRFTIGRNTVGNETGNQTIKKIAYYPRRLSNEELQEMTS